MLAELQEQFVDSLKRRELGVLKSLIVSEGVDPEQRMNVYANHLGITLRELLAMAYPVLLQHLGEDEFTRLCVSYCRQNPMAEPEAWLLGKGLSEVMASDGELGGRKSLIDLARLERAAQECFYAADLEPLPVTFLAGLDEQSLMQYRFRLMPDARIFAVGSQALEYWSDHGTVEWLDQPHKDGSNTSILMKRADDGDVVAFQMADDEFRFLSMLAEGQDFLSSYEKILQIFSDFDVQQVYQQAIIREVFAVT